MIDVVLIAALACVALLWMFLSTRPPAPRCVQCRALLKAKSDRTDRLCSVACAVEARRGLRDQIRADKRLHPERQ